MAEQLIPLDQFFQLREKLPLIDARSEGEFAQSHIPSAVNLPILNNEERIEVGTLYKKQGPEKATLKGFEIVGPRFHLIQKEALKLFPEKKVILYCWRGGMRSQILSWLLEMVGFEIYRLRGGYKVYRKFTFDLVRSNWDLLVLGGRTGTGKTRILTELRLQGEQVIDLEALANHKGSSFGAIGQEPQPTVEQFENLLAEELKLLDSSLPIWVENESRKIGRIILADRLYEQMCAAPFILIEKSTEERIALISEEYADLPEAELISAVRRLGKRLGGLRTQQAIDAIQSKNHADWISNLLIYYDKAYDFDQSRHQDSKTITLELNQTAMSETISLVIQAKNKLYGKTTHPTN